MASLVFAGPFYQEAELIEITIKDRFFDNDKPTSAYFSGDFCYTDNLLLEVKLTLSQTNAMGPDSLYGKAIDLWDQTIDSVNASSPLDDYLMTWEVYCGFPTYWP